MSSTSDAAGESVVTEPAHTTSYDEIPYESRPFPQTYPIRLATVATLFGLTPPPVDRCRVLELGCAGGGNLIPMADALSESRFVGIDYSSRQVGEGHAKIAAAGLKNVEILHKSILDVDADFGEFDYVLCHGVFSWVSREVQEKILEVCRRHLSPDGVAYVSYNTYPGWRMRGMIRDMMLFHVGRFKDNVRRIQQARALLKFLSESAASDKDAYAILLKSELQMLSQQADSYLFHEHLESVNEPLYFHQFVERAAAHGLVYLGESEVSTMWSGNFGEKVQQTLKGVESDVVQAEQYMDFLRNRLFRQTLLCHAGKKIDRRLHLPNLTAFYVATNLAPDGADSLASDASTVTFRSSRGTVSTSSPLLKAALAHLHEQWPQSVRIDELAEVATRRLERESASPVTVPGAGARFLSEHLIRFYLKNLVELAVRPFDFIVTVGERPQASLFVRRQAESGHLVTNRRHESWRVDEFCRQLLRRLDGSHDQTALCDTLLKAAAEGQLTIRRRDGQEVLDAGEQRSLVTDGVRTGLESLARGALLVA